MKNIQITIQKWLLGRRAGSISSAQPGHEQRPRSVWTFLGSTWVWILFFGVIYLIILLKALTYETIYNDLFFGFYSLLITWYILSRFVFSYFHRPVALDRYYEPSITFVVPAKNEEDNIADTINCFTKVNYPLDKVEIIAINDGSDDGTLREMRRALSVAEPVVARVELVDWEVNRGKRHGMAEGVKRATHEVIVFIDSDSFIDPDCVRHMVKYFSNPAIGAVSGHTDVYNRSTNLLTQMQALRYYIAFSIYKSAESVFGSVTCCPGCCSAYRRAYIRVFIDEWLQQRFLNSTCTFGDDRSLTNYIIREHQAVYAPEARAQTVVPETFSKYMRQQLRWKKSWIRETFIAAQFMWQKPIGASISFYIYIFLAFVSPIVFLRAVVWYPSIHHVWPLVYLGGLFLMLLLHGLYYRAQVGRRAWLLAVFSFWFHTVVLMWQLPWAALTLRDSRWGTR